MIIITSKYGELGNRLITFSNAIAIARKNNLTVMNFAFDEYADYFVGTSENLFCRFPPKKSLIQPRRFLRALIARVFDHNARVHRICSLFADVIELGWKQRFYFEDPARLGQSEKIRSGKLTFVSGLYFLDPAGLCEHADVIRKYFQPNPYYQGRVNQIMDTGRQACDVLVGVHVRQGDYINFCDGIYYYSNEEFQCEMRKVALLFPEQRVGFLVVSNEPHQVVFSEDLLVFKGSGHFIEDMYCLAACDYIMGPPSTFSIWSSFYGNVPRYEINYKKQILHGFNHKPLQLSDFCKYIPSADETETRFKREEFKEWKELDERE